MSSPVAEVAFPIGLILRHHGGPRSLWDPEVLRFHDEVEELLPGVEVVTAASEGWPGLEDAVSALATTSVRSAVIVDVGSGQMAPATGRRLPLRHAGRATCPTTAAVAFRSAAGPASDAA